MSGRIGRGALTLRFDPAARSGNLRSTCSACRLTCRPTPDLPASTPRSLDSMSLRVAQLKAPHTVADWHSDPGGFNSDDLGSVSVFVQMGLNDPRDRKIKLVLKPWACVKDMKDQLQAMLNIPTSAQQLFYKGTELSNVRNLVQCGIYQDKVVVHLVLSANARKKRANMYTIHPYGNHVFPKTIMKAAHLAMQGLALGLVPELAMDGTGGTYFLKDPTQRKVCCFKPQNEEPFAPMNPRGFVAALGESGFRKGVLSGEACEREVAAYLLDKDHFAGVPATTLTEIKHPAFRYGEGEVVYKMGSLQEFVRHDDVVSDLSPSMFSAHQVHKIVLLDMRIVNTDRNDANILVRKRRNANGDVEHELIPIDHGYSLPDYMEVGSHLPVGAHELQIAWCDWCWFSWPQLKVPISEEDRQYILSINVDQEIQRLSAQVPLRAPCRRNMKIAGMLVEKGVRRRVLLHDLARFMCREDLDAPSRLELLCQEALHQACSPRPSPRHAPRRADGKPALSIDVSALPEDPGTLLSPPGFWASFDPFNDAIESVTSPIGSPKNGLHLQSWEALSSSYFHADVQELFGRRPSEPASGDTDAARARLLDTDAKLEKHFLHLVSRMLDEELDAMGR
ncbi:phosphatidylinositol kinase (PIK-F) [Achlya hypogyna]|uniref:Phosphatidylinositol kinase (PIK-F) n=1 Tax=Achlya hypogyna TaxID=1202772 RepID=A0A1V9YQN6_ACHHY|nr:phosphatidylinositol kinase (PIK-F) [Achlya hypogyna]